MTKPQPAARHDSSQDLRAVLRSRRSQGRQRPIWSCGGRCPDSGRIKPAPLQRPRGRSGRSRRRRRFRRSPVDCRPDDYPTSHGTGSSGAAGLARDGVRSDPPSCPSASLRFPTATWRRHGRTPTDRCTRASDDPPMLLTVLKARPSRIDAIGLHEPVIADGIGAV